MTETNKEFAQTPGLPPLLREGDGRIIRMIPIHLLDEPLNPMRHDMSDERLSELMTDIREHGLLQNLCVVPVRNGERVGYTPAIKEVLDRHEAELGRYRVAAGHRRLLALRAINFEAARCLVFCDLRTTEQAIMSIENGSREEPSDYDLAVMYSEWMREPGITEAEMRRRAGKSLDFVYARVELLNGWQFVADALHAKKIPFSVARALNREDNEGYAKMFLDMAVDQGATGRLANAWVSEHKAHVDMTPSGCSVEAVGAPVVVAPIAPVECALCGERQSYLLRTALFCVTDLERIKAARAQIQADNEAAKVEGGQAEN